MTRRQMDDNLHARMHLWLLMAAAASICLVAGVKDITSDMKLNMEGIIVGYGDFNSDKATDVFTISRHTELFVHFWDVTKQTFKPPQNLNLELLPHSIILNIALADFNGDGSMDILVSSKLAKAVANSGVTVEVYFGNGKTVLKGADNITMVDQPTLVDVNGDLLPDLFGTSVETKLRSYWISMFNKDAKGKHTFKVETQYLYLTTTLYPQTSHGFVDATGDLHPDLFVMAESDKDESPIFEVWEQKGAILNFTRAFLFNISETPKVWHYGQMSFADIDSDSVTEVILPVCLTADCSKSAIYAKSLTHGSNWRSLLDNSINADFSWKFPLKNMEKQTTTTSTTRSMFPFTLRFNDLTMDGNVDAVAILQNTAPALRDRLQPVYLVNVKCYPEKVSGCFNGRTLRVTPLDRSGVEHPVLISLFDVNENGILDFMITYEDASTLSSEESSKKYKSRILQNDLNFDTAFVKVAVLSGLQSMPAAYGANQIGAVVQISTTNTDGSAMLGQSIQLSQSSYFSLQLPYVIFGLGKSPNFIDQISVGIPKGPQTNVDRRKTWTAIIPNAQVIVVPYPKDEPYDWVTKLLVTPGKLLLQTGGVLIGTILLIGGIILILHIKEKREDEREKRRDAHKFHFDAL